MEKFPLIVFCALMGVVGWAQADMRVGDVIHVEGTVSFEKRHTVIPMIQCVLEPNCIRSKVYWSVVLHGDSAQYEIDEQFAVGENVAPESLVIAGQTITPGSLLKVGGKVEYVSEHYVILGDIQSNLELSTLSLPNWRCSGTLNNRTEVQVDVWRTAPLGDLVANLYTVKVSRRSGDEQVVIAKLTNAQGIHGRNQFIYQGEKDGDSVAVMVDHPVDENESSAGTLTYTKFPQRLETDVFCEKMR